MGENKLKTKRLEYGYTQAQLAEMAGINTRTYERYENGYNDLSGINAKSLINLCRVLQCEPSELIDREVN